MAKCKDGRKFVIVKGFHRKDGVEVKEYERSCPTNISHCEVCGKEVPDADLHVVNIKGMPKKICRECADIVHGLI